MSRKDDKKHKRGDKKRKHGATEHEGTETGMNVETKPRAMAVAATAAAIQHEPDLAIGMGRVVIERVTPELDGGQHPVKRVVGDLVTVEADIFTDGH